MKTVTQAALMRAAADFDQAAEAFERLGEAGPAKFAREAKARVDAALAQGDSPPAPDDRPDLKLVEEWCAAERALGPAMEAFRKSPGDETLRREARAAFDATLKAMGRVYGVLEPLFAVTQ